MSLTSSTTQSGEFIDPRTHRSSVWRKLGYALGDFAYNFMWWIVSALLLVFYTDVFLIPAAVVSLFMLIIRLTDAVVDPIAGSIADRTNTRWGRYRPYVLFAPMVLVGSMILMFWAHPDWSQPAKVTYAVITFSIAALASTFTNMPYGALNAVISVDTDERLSFSSFRMAAGMISSALVGFIIFPLIDFFKGSGENPMVQGYVFSVAALGAVAIVLFVICFLSTRELIKLAPDRNQPKLKDLWRSVLANRPLQIVVIGFFIYGFVGYGRVAVMAFFFQYNIGDTGLFGPFNLVATGCGVVGAMLAPVLLRLVPSGNKAKVVIGSLVGQAVFFGSMFFVASAETMVWFFVLGAFGGVSMGVFITGIFGMVPDTVEYGEHKVGFRSEGFNYAFTSLAIKWGGAAGPAALGFLLAAVGYVPNVDQAPAVLTSINMMMTLVPAALCVVAAVPFLFYKLDRRRFNEIVDELEGLSASESASADG